MSVLEGIEPKGVMYFFEKLSEIPRGSGNTAAAAEFCMSFARSRGLECHLDKAGNCIIIKEAAPGYEGAAPVIIQGHLDMVCEKEENALLDMSAEGLRLRVEGDKISAEGTTLGGDDGIAVAMALAILDDKTIPHPRLEVLLTADEEIGMIGAAKLDPSPLKGRRLLNIDSEEEGVFTVSCAGGNVTKCIIPVSREDFPGDSFEIKISGLKGGHSGVEIDKGRANADMLLGRVLRTLEKSGKMRVISVSGGLMDNAIPAAACAVVKLDGNPEGVLKECENIFAAEFAASDAEIKISASGIADPEYAPMTEEASHRVVSALCCMPDGIQRMSMNIPGLVQTSLNLGILKTSEEAVEASFCVRSSVSSEKDALTERLKLMTELLGGSCEIIGDYPPWEYLTDSPLRELMKKIYIEMYGSEPKIEAIHAGVECGILAGKLPGLECVSFGPNLSNIHTPSETMSIASVKRVWEFLLKVLAELRQ
ncbi:MAG: aminoacyl-histidine dipeptidase [Clostridia bacterium]|nr:aminoacyl-histidine dipeptidase [Clostridia bacterium]